MTPAVVVVACGGGSSESPAPAAKGFYGARDLKVAILEGGPGDPAIDHVLDGRSDFAISSFGEQRDAVAGDLPTVALMSAFQIPPLVIYSLAESGITTPRPWPVGRGLPHHTAS